MPKPTKPSSPPADGLTPQARVAATRRARALEARAAADAADSEAEADVESSGPAAPRIPPGPLPPEIPAEVEPTSLNARHRAAIEAAEAGQLPEPPDFTAATHVPYRKKLDALVGLAHAGDAEGLRAVVINPTSTSPKALIRYRALALVAIKARTAATIG